MKDPSKTERATPKRRNKARREGNVPKSQEMTKTVTIVVGLLGMYLYFTVIVEHVSRVFRYFFANVATMPVTQESAYAVFTLAVKETAIMVLPVMLALALGAYACLRVQVGKLWTTKVFKPKFKFLNIIGGLKRIFFSPQTFVRLGKSALLAAVIGFVPYAFIRSEMENFLPLYHENAAGLGAYMLRMGFRMTLYTLAPMVVIAVADLVWTRFQYEENLKMSKDEVKDERKQAEGDPKIKQQQRQKMMAFIAKRMMKEVPRADVVITNPTHYAVALRYDPTVCPAPLVVAKGMNKVAERIKLIAREHHVPIRENRPLAQSLYRLVEVGQPIPEELYKAVAAVLAQIWKMQGKMPQRPGQGPGSASPGA